MGEEKNTKTIVRNVDTNHLTAEEIRDKIQTNPGELPIKHFEARNSPITDLLEIKHIQTIHHLFIVIVFSLFCITAVNDGLHGGKSNFGCGLILKGFANFHHFVLIWTGMFLTSFAIYYGFKCWATIRVRFVPKSQLLKQWDTLWLSLIVLFYPCFMYLSTKSVLIADQPTVASCALLMEMTRFLMKSHAFVRSNAPRVLKYKPHTDDQILYPDMSKFLYFSFAPTLVYQDDYPRSRIPIRWNYVFGYILEFIACVFLLSFLTEMFITNPYQNYGIKPYTWQDITLILFRNALPGFLMITTIFYIILHLWHNIFAEILLFADRLFYKDWWTSTAYGRYYRTWNVVVHDWLYTYIYKDFYEIVIPRNKNAAKIMVFFVSAAFHDYVLGFSFRFYSPILFLNFFIFGLSVSYLTIKSRVLGNVFFLYTFGLGMSINIAGFTLEYYSRVHCPVENPDFLSYFTQQLFTCGR